MNSAGILSSQNNLCWRWRPPLGERLFPRAGSCDIECSQAAKGVSESQDILVDVFGRIESFFVRLEMYTGVSLTPAMTDKMVQITVETLGVLGTATKEMEESRASEFDLRLTFPGADIGPEKFLKKVAGRTDLEDGLKKLEKLTNEEIAMASARLVKVTDNIDNKVTEVGDDVRAVGEGVQFVKGEVRSVGGEVQVVRRGVQVVEGEVQVVKGDVQAVIGEVQLVSDNVQAVGDKLQTIADGKKSPFKNSPPSSPTFII